jgi:hypothetical protein
MDCVGLVQDRDRLVGSLCGNEPPEFTKCREFLD